VRYTLTTVTRAATESAGPAVRPVLLAGAVVTACFLGLFAQVAATPLGEGMDVDGHLAYVVFMVREGRWPTPGELSMPADVAALRAHCLASDYVCPGSYQRWALLSPSARQTERAWLLPQEHAAYVGVNYEAQHPPLYYALASLVDRPIRRLPYDRQLFCLSVLSVAMAATALPALWLVFRRRLGANVALGLLLAVAWFPNLMPFLGRVTNDALAFPIVCWFLAAVDRPVMRRGNLVAGALLLIVGLLVKSYVLVLVPVYLIACLVKGEGRRLDWKAFAVGLALLSAGLVPLVAFNLATTGLPMPLYEAQLTAGEPFSRKLLGLFQVRWVLFLTLMARGSFWSGYWSWVAPGPWYYLPMAAPLLLFVPRRPPTDDAPGAAWWRAVLSDAWVHLASLVFFLLAMWWHAGLLALDAQVRGRSQFLGGEGWYLNVLIGCTAVVLGVAARARYGDRMLCRLTKRCAVLMIAWNLVARLTLCAFWGGSVRLWSGLRFASLADVLAALTTARSWAAWQSWPGVTGPVSLAQVLPLAVALALSAWALRGIQVPVSQTPGAA